MKKRFLRWNRRRRFIKAYKILRNEAERHRGSGHVVQFEVINESHVILTCQKCPCLQPFGPRKVF